MRYVLLLGILLGCGGDADETYDCEQLSRSVGQRIGTCRLAYDPDAPFGNGCPSTLDAYCLPDGLPASCPSGQGWSIGCDSDSDGSEINCHYGSPVGCTGIDPGGTFDFGYVQTLNGISGLGVHVISTGRCEFRPCNPG